MKPSSNPNLHTDYNISSWSDGYFAIDENGELMACPKPSSEHGTINLPTLVSSAQKQGLRLPILFRFTDILQDRVSRLYHAFNQAIIKNHFNGDYQAVYPIKVNQQKRVVEAIIEHTNHPVGLEAGSKPELIAVLAHSKPNRSVIICNGYKDESYIRLAILGQHLGHQIYLVVEKLSEIKLILKQAHELKIKPKLGVRVRLATVGNSNWQNTGGEKAKFGLTSYQTLQLIEILEKANALDYLQLLHVHMGSQITNINDIENAVEECARFYVNLRKLNIPIDCIDVGGGLGIDYEGTQSRNLCSTNYTMEEYAEAIIATVQRVCDQENEPHPNIITEAGRAMTAHHAVLITNIVESEKSSFGTPQPAENNVNELKKLTALWQTIHQNDSKTSLTELFHQLNNELSKIYQQFSAGTISLQDRAQAEQYYFISCHLLLEKLDSNLRSHREIIDRLHEKLAIKLFANFSVFQSIPDVWGISQIFPIMPLSGLNQQSKTRAIIHDLTCDSDGRIDQYVDNGGIETTLPITINENSPSTLLGFFLVGAYQEILGDMHNLFGDTDAVDVMLDDNNEYHLTHLTQGDSIASALRYVNYNPAELINLLEIQVKQSEFSETEKSKFFTELNNAFEHYTYFD